jgi:VIT1/CCC1 family predicted Fe2+/Mn2+ transporter
MRPDPRRALASAVTIGGACALGGLIPLGPDMVVATTRPALTLSAVVTLVALAIFGYTKGGTPARPPVGSAMQTVPIGGLAAAVAFLIGTALS